MAALSTERKHRLFRAIRLSRALFVTIALLLGAPSLLAQQGEAAEASAEVDAAASDQAPGSAPALAPSSWREPLEAARAAFDEAAFEDALENARQAAQAIRDAAGDTPEDPTLRAALVRALDVVAQSLFNLGNEAGARSSMESLIRLDPGFAVEERMTGRRYAEAFRERRAALVTTIQVSCRPLPCTTITIGERERRLGEDQRVDVLAGTKRVELERSSFSEQVFEELELEPGKVVTLDADLVQIARDLVVRTRPPGVNVLLDGELVGVTLPPAPEPDLPEAAAGEQEALEPLIDPPPPSEEGVSAPFVLREVPPGQHVITFEAPCLRRVAAREEVVLDQLDPGPRDLGVVRLDPARAYAIVEPPQSEGTLLVDGEPAEPGRIELCPGEHSFVLARGARRLWFEELDLVVDDERRLVPRPRPTIAASPGAALEALEDSAEYNRVVLAPEDLEALRSALDAALGGAAPPIYPTPRRVALPLLAERLERLPADVDLVLAAIEGLASIRDTRLIVLADPGEGIAEVASVPSERATSAFAALLEERFDPYRAFLGIDVARTERGLVIAEVAPGSVAERAGVSEGALLRRAGGEELSSVAGFDAWRAALEPGEALTLTLESGGEESEVGLTPPQTLFAPLPETLRGHFLLLRLAQARAMRERAEPASRVAGGLASGLVLAALGREESAASVLDRVALDDAFDPAGDARATTLFVLHALLERLGDPYAGEVGTRFAALDKGRIGGREGVPLRAAPGR